MGNLWKTVTVYSQKIYKFRKTPCFATEWAGLFRIDGFGVALAYDRIAFQRFQHGFQHGSRVFSRFFVVFNIWFSQLHDFAVWNRTSFFAMRQSAKRTKTG